MSNKRYYWLKLKEDFFEDETIEFIESQKNGVKYVNFYLKLLLKSLKNEGYLIRYIGEKLIPYDLEALSRLTNCDFDTVRSAMDLFTEIGIVKKMESGEIYLTQINEMIGSETKKAESMRRLRAKRRKNEQINEGGNNVTGELPEVTEPLLKRYTEKEIELDKELEKELEKRDKNLDKENKNVKSNSEDEKKESIPVSEVFILLQNEYTNQVTPIKLESLIPEIEKIGENATDIISLAIDYAKNKTNNLNYLVKIINNWADEGISTVEQAKEKISGKQKKNNTSWIDDELNTFGGDA